MQAGEQPGLEQQFGLLSEFPRVVAVSGQIKKYAVMKDKFSIKALEGFLTEFISGKAKYMSLVSKPTIVDVELIKDSV